VRALRRGLSVVNFHATTALRHHSPIRLAEARTAKRRSDSVAASSYQGTSTRVQPTLCRYGQVFLQDLANVEAEIYPLPADRDGSLLTLINLSRLFFEDLPEIDRRREGRAHNEIFNKATRGTRIDQRRRICKTTCPARLVRVGVAFALRLVTAEAFGSCHCLCCAAI